MKFFSRRTTEFIHRTDMPLLLFCLACSAFGMLLLYGIYTSGNVRLRTLYVQCIATLLGLCCACVISAFDYRDLAQMWKIYVPVAVSFVVLTYFVGMKRQGYEYVDDKAWLPIPFTGLTFQPSELLKLALILSLALRLEQAGSDINEPRTLLPLLAHGGAAVVLVLLQGDTGTAMVVAIIVCAMLFSAGLSFRYVIAAIAAIAAASPLVWIFLLDDDKKQRFRVLLDPSLDPSGAGWQQSLSLMAIGSGQSTGKGILSGTAQYVPEMYNDFIFAFMGESLGFIGCLGVLVAVAVLGALLLRNALQARDALGRYICVGVFTTIIFQELWGIGMALSLFPVAGLTMPFFSAGGTSVVMTYAAVGLVLSVHRASHIEIFEK